MALLYRPCLISRSFVYRSVARSPGEPDEILTGSRPVDSADQRWQLRQAAEWMAKTFSISYLNIEAWLACALARFERQLFPHGTVY